MQLEKLRELGLCNALLNKNFSGQLSLFANLTTDSVGPPKILHLGTNGFLERI